MEHVSGKSVFGGIAIGTIRELLPKNYKIKRTWVEDTAEELARLEQAKAKTKTQLQKVYEKAVKEVGKDHAAIFEIHQMMLDDLDYLASIQDMIITQSANAEFAVEATAEKFAGMFAQMDDDYMKARAADVKDVSERLIRVLSDKVTYTIQMDEDKKYIVVADDLAPSETILLNREKVLAFVTRKGSTNSHTAILARTMNIPALVLTPVPEGIDGKEAIVDGFSGTIILEPDEIVRKYYEEKMQKEALNREVLEHLRGKRAITEDGKEIKLYANIGGVGDVDAVIQNDAAGIGLFRSEFLYLQSEDYPTEEEQFQAYKTVAERMAGKRVIVRTLDIGADKKTDYFHLDDEDNPALGYRAIRICLTRPEIFRTQLRALLRASAFGNIAIMFPMITSLWELKEAKGLMKEVKKELAGEGTAYQDVEVGVMIETPAAVMIADDLAREADFFSIGTNDLTQYTLAIDRQNENLDKFYDARHPAILRMMDMVIESAHKAGIWVGICGELGADLELTELFIRMGIDELSVSPPMILPIRDKIIHSNVKG